MHEILLYFKNLLYFYKIYYIGKIQNGSENVYIEVRNLLVESTRFANTIERPEQ